MGDFGFGIGDAGVDRAALGRREIEDDSIGVCFDAGRGLACSISLSTTRLASELSVITLTRV